MGSLQVAPAPLQYSDSGSLYKKYHRDTQKNGFQHDAEALASDWAAVGADLNKAMAIIGSIKGSHNSKN